MTKKKKRLLTLSFFIISAVLFLLSFVFSPYDSVIESMQGVDCSKMISLTFDDGPGDYTQKLLDGLKERNIQASFFVLGKKIDAHTDVIKQMYDDGHLIGNHTYSHIDFLKSSKNTIRKELDSTNKMLKAITGEDCLFYRPPYGHYLGTTLNGIDDMIAVSWSNDPADWKHMDYDYVYHYIISHAKDGEIFLLHDTKESTVNAVLDAMDVLTSEGFTFARVDDLLCRNGDPLYPAVGYRSCRNCRKPVAF